MADQTAPKASAEGSRSIAISGDAINSFLVTGDNNTFFVGRYERLVDAYLNPLGLFHELTIDDFTGREWLVAEVDRFIASNSCGYLIIEAEAGLGKSVFVAWLARERGYPHHFMRLMPDPHDSSIALRNLSAQIIGAWDLSDLAVGGVLPPSIGRTDSFRLVLEAAARRRDEVRPGEPIVLLVDGLHETRPPSGQNPAGLPASLPDGVYVIATQRPVIVPFRYEVPRKVIALEASAEENLGDIRRYLETIARREQLGRALAAAGMSPRDFAEVLVERSQGVWVYLHYVIAEIARGTRRPDQLDRLPLGLWQYYASYWYAWQTAHPDTWATVDLPLLAVLAAADEPLSSEQLRTFAGIGEAPDVEALLDGEWRPFLQIDEPRYRTFHDSLNDFLHGDVDVDELASGERTMVKRLSRATRAAHGQIADHFLTSWGGLSRGLPGVNDDGYGLRHVVRHLASAGRTDEMHELLSASRAGGQGENLWFSVHQRNGSLGAYRRDLDQAWSAARNAGAAGSSLQMRYALITCSLNSQITSTPPGLWSLLLRQGELAPEEALVQARQIPVPQERAEAITRLIPSVPAGIRGRVEREALGAVRTTPDGYWRIGELCRLQEVISPELHGDLVTIAKSLTELFDRTIALRMLGVPTDEETEQIPDGTAGEQDPDSPTGLAGAERFIEAYLNNRDFAVSLLRSAGIRDDGEWDDPAGRYWATQMAISSASEGHGRVIDDHAEAAAVWAALAAGGPVEVTPKDPMGKAAISADDLAALSDSELAKLARTFAAAASHIRDGDQRAEVRSALVKANPDLAVTVADELLASDATPKAASHLARAIPSLPAAVLKRATVWAAGLPDTARAELTTPIAVRLCELGSESAARELADQLPSRSRGEIVRALADWQAQSGDPAEAIRLANQLSPASWRAEIFARAANRLPPPDDQVAIDRVYALASAFDPPNRIPILARAAVFAPMRHRTVLFESARDIAGDMSNGFERAMALYGIATSQVAAGNLIEAIASARAITDQKVRADVLRFILQHEDTTQLTGTELITELDGPADRAPLWVLALRKAPSFDTFTAALRDLSTRPRTELFAHAAILIPAAVSLGGPMAVNAIAADLANAQQWWP